MFVVVENKHDDSGDYEIWIPYEKCRKCIISHLRDIKKLNREEAEQYIDKVGQRKLEEKYRGTIKNCLYGFVQNEVKMWNIYEDKIRRGMKK